MARYLSFHAGSEGKMTRKDVKGLAGHTFRKTEQRYKNHGNEDIDTSMTKHNIDWISQEGKSLDEVVNERLEKDYKGKRALRKDAVVLREIIIQASPSVYEGLTLKQKRKKAADFTNDSLKWFAKEFGRENVIGASVHLDETNPHTHVVIMPMTKDGRISQKDFFKGPKDLKRMHREYRKHMNDLGWEFEEENKYENVDGVSLPKYKANAKEIEKKREEQTEAIRSLLSDDEIRQEATDIVLNEILRSEREKMADKEKELEAKEKELNSREQNLDKREVMLNGMANELQKKDDDLTERELRVEQSERIVDISGVVLSGLLQGNPRYDKMRQAIDRHGVGVLSKYSNKSIGDLVKNQMANARLGNLKIDTIEKTHDRIVHQDHEQDGPSL